MKTSKEMAELFYNWPSIRGENIIKEILDAVEYRITKKWCSYYHSRKDWTKYISLYFALNDNKCFGYYKLPERISWYDIKNIRPDMKKIWYKLLLDRKEWILSVLFDI